jgi:hypothetical protein
MLTWYLDVDNRCSGMACFNIEPATMTNSIIRSEAWKNQVLNKELLHKRGRLKVSVALPPEVANLKVW